MELSISKKEDLSKLEGWTIKGATFQADGSDPSIALRVEHPLAGCPVLLTIIGAVSFGRSGNIMIVNSVINFKTQDIKESQ